MGQAIPLFIAIPSLPVLVTNLGLERFGVLTLIWLVVGYFSLFDLGLGRALTQVISRRLGEESKTAVLDIVKAGVSLMALVSLAGAGFFWIISPWLAYSVLSIPTSLQAESLTSFYVVAIAVPFIVTSSGLTGVLAAYQRFDIVNVVRTPAAVLTVLLPVVVSEFTARLDIIAGILVVTRIVAWAVYVLACCIVLPQRTPSDQPNRVNIGQLISLGGWMTATNILSPFLVYVDRFVIAGVVSVVAVAYYATPYEVITKLWIVPGAIVGALFPAFAITYVTDKSRTSYLFARGTKYVFLSLFPVVFVIIIFAKEILGVWLGPEFAENSASVLQVLALGVFVNSLAFPAAVLVQGAGRPDKITKLHVIELIVYLPILWYLTVRFGIQGAAAAWTLRVGIDAVLLCSIALSLLSWPRHEQFQDRKSVV